MIIFTQVVDYVNWSENHEWHVVDSVQVEYNKTGLQPASKPVEHPRLVFKTVGKVCKNYA